MDAHRCTGGRQTLRLNEAQASRWRGVAVVGCGREELACTREGGGNEAGAIGGERGTTTSRHGQGARIAANGKPQTQLEALTMQGRDPKHRLEGVVPRKGEDGGSSSSGGVLTLPLVNNLPAGAASLLGCGSAFSLADWHRLCDCPPKA